MGNIQKCILILLVGEYHMQIHEIIIKYIEANKFFKDNLQTMFIIGIVCIIVPILFGILFGFGGSISLLSIGIGFYILFPKIVYDNHKYEKTNSHIKPFYYSQAGLPGYFLLLAGSIFIFGFVISVIWRGW